MLPVVGWARGYRRSDLRSDLAAGLTIGAMLVPQAMAYALLAGLPPAVGLYSATVPVLIYALLGTSRQLAVGPVAIVSLLTATGLAPLYDEGTAGYIAAAALLALMVGVVHLALGLARLGQLVNLLSHAVLVGFTAAAAIIIGFSQVKHLFGVSVARQEHFYQTVLEVASGLDSTNGMTLVVGLTALVAILGLKRWAPGWPAALVVVVGSILAVRLFDLEARGVEVIGDIPDSLPAFGLPDLSGGLLADLFTTALVITFVGFMESIAVAKTYARRHRYDVDPNQELVGLGAANVAAGLFGGYPVTGGFSRTAVNDSAGARTPLASVVTAAIVLLTIAFLTPTLRSLPNAALGAIIITAVIGLIDGAEMRHIARVKRTDLISLIIAFVATLALGIELGIVVAVVASMLVVFARMSAPHSAVLGHVDGTTTYRNVDRFPEVSTVDGVRIIRIDAAVSFVNAANVKRLLLSHADEVRGRALVLDASGINDLDATGADMFRELLDEMVEREVAFHLTDTKGPVRDVMRAADLWSALAGRCHASTHDAVAVITGNRSVIVDHRRGGIDEHGINEVPNTTHSRRNESMKFTQYYLDCLSHASYLIGDPTTGRAVVVDPRRDVAEYVDDAAAEGLTIELVIETHLHADFLSGHLELAAATGATIAYGSAADTEFPSRKLADGERISLGQVELEIRHTPGHTPESISVVVWEKGDDPEPYGVLTGDALFIGDVGRPDLLTSVGHTGAELAEQLYHSLHTKLLPLPDATRVYPAHGAGSACGKNLSTDTWSTMGEQRRTNYALLAPDRDSFIELVTEGQPPAPGYFAYDAALNRLDRPLLDEIAPPVPLDAAALDAALDAGAIVLDARDADEFARGHLIGSINVGLGGRYAEFVGSVVSGDDEIVLVVEPGTELEAKNRLARIGFDRVVGAVDEPLAVMAARLERVGRASRLTATDLVERQGSGAEIQLVDVRNPGEVEGGSIPGAIAIPVGQLPDRLAELDPLVSTVVFCAGGYRSSVAASVLRRGGFADVSDIVGGYGAWQQTVIVA